MTLDYFLYKLLRVMVSGLRIETISLAKRAQILHTYRQQVTETYKNCHKTILAFLEGMLSVNC